MAERRSRRRFMAEFKAQAVKRLLDGGKGLSEVATGLGRPSYSQPRSVTTIPSSLRNRHTCNTLVPEGRKRHFFLASSISERYRFDF